MNMQAAPVDFAQWLRPDEASELLGISLRTLQYKAGKGEIERRKVGRKSYYKVCATPAYEPIVPRSTRRNPKSVDLLFEAAAELASVASDEELMEWTRRLRARVSTDLASTDLASTGLASTDLASTGLASTDLASTGLDSTDLADVALVWPTPTAPLPAPTAEVSAEEEAAALAFLADLESCTPWVGEPAELAGDDETLSDATFRSDLSALEESVLVGCEEFVSDANWAAESLATESLTTESLTTESLATESWASAPTLDLSDEARDIVRTEKVEAGRTVEPAGLGPAASEQALADAGGLDLDLDLDPDDEEVCAQLRRLVALHESASTQSVAFVEPALPESARLDDVTRDVFASESIAHPVDAAFEFVSPTGECITEEAEVFARLRTLVEQQESSLDFPEIHVPVRPPPRQLEREHTSAQCLVIEPNIRGAAPSKHVERVQDSRVYAELQRLIDADANQTNSVHSARGWRSARKTVTPVSPAWELIRTTVMGLLFFVGGLLVASQVRQVLDLSGTIAIVTSLAIVLGTLGLGFMLSDATQPASRRSTARLGQPGGAGYGGGRALRSAG